MTRRAARRRWPKQGGVKPARRRWGQANQARGQRRAALRERAPKGGPQPPTRPLTLLHVLQPPQPLLLAGRGGRRGGAGAARHALRFGLGPAFDRPRAALPGGRARLPASRSPGPAPSPPPTNTSAGAHMKSRSVRIMARSASRHFRSSPRHCRSSARHSRLSAVSYPVRSACAASTSLSSIRRGQARGRGVGAASPCTRKRAARRLLPSAVRAAHTPRRHEGYCLGVVNATSRPWRLYRQHRVG
jgi:hypothetical protein